MFHWLWTFEGAWLQGSAHRKSKIDRKLCQQADKVQEFQQKLAQLPQPQWDVDIDTHAH